MKVSSCRFRPASSHLTPQSEIVLRSGTSPQAVCCRHRSEIDDRRADRTTSTHQEDSPPTKPQQDRRRPAKGSPAQPLCRDRPRAAPLVVTARQFPRDCSSGTVHRDRDPTERPFDHSSEGGGPARCLSQTSFGRPNRTKACPTMLLELRDQSRLGL